jgi:hypothetical protein
MKQLFLSMILIFGFVLVYSQQACESTRYKEALFPEVNVYEDIIYAEAVPFRSSKKEDYRFDFYEPMNDNIEKRPLVLMFCGGDFQNGDKKDSEVKTWCDSLATYGFTCAAMNYRLGYNPKRTASVERAIYRSVQDVRAAIRYFKEFHNTFKIDTNQIYIGGDEAGAVAVLHAAFIQNEQQRVRSTYGTNGENSDLGCLDCSGNAYSQSAKIAGLINMRGKITDVDLRQAREKIPMIHIEDAVLAVDDEAQNPLKILQMKSATTLHAELDRLGHPTTHEEVAIFNSSGMTSSMQSTEIWNAVWQQIRNFLFETMSFTSPVPKGVTEACAGKPTTYKIDKVPGSVYCWEVEGGRIMESNEGSIEVIWDYDNIQGSILVIGTSITGVVGRPSSPLYVKLRDAAVSDFSIQRIEDNVVEVKDESSYGSFFTLDFGDESSPVSGKPGEKIYHTFDLKGDYTISQVLENSCGTAMSTQRVEIKKVSIDAWDVLRAAIVLENDSFTLGENIVIPTNSTIFYPFVKIDITHDNGQRLFSETIELTKTKEIILAKEQLITGKYTIQITADGNTVKRYFEVVN